LWLSLIQGKSIYVIHFDHFLFDLTYSDFVP